MSINTTGSGCCGSKQQPIQQAPANKEEKSGCCAAKQPASAEQSSTSWKRKYYAALAVLAVLWLLAYNYILPASTWLVFDVLGFAQNSHLGAAAEFFIYDTVKILLLLAALIYGIAWLRAAVDMERVRNYLVACL